MSKGVFAIKAAIADPKAREFEFTAQKTMYGGKKIAAGDVVYLFASESDGGSGLIAMGTVLSAKAVRPRAGVARQTPRVSIAVRRVKRVRRALGGAEIKAFSDWDDGRPETELNFKFYRQATHKIVGLSRAAAKFLSSRF